MTPQQNRKAIARHCSIHETAIIAPDAVIGAHCIIHPYAIVGPRTQLGEGCEVHSFAHVGSTPQVREHDDQTGRLIIGAGNRFFEGCTVSRGREQFGGITRIGDNNLFMAYSHIGHDCTLGHGITIANHTSLAGHVELEDHVNLGGYVGVHQFVRIGTYAFVAANSMVSQDVLPFGIAAGDRARLIGFNRKGLARSNFSVSESQAIRRAFGWSSHSSTSTNGSDERWCERFHTFKQQSKRGVLKRNLSRGTAERS